MTLSVLTNAVVCLLLITAIVLGVILTRKLAALRAAQGELAALGETFVEATAKAEAGLAELRKTAEVDGGALQDHVARAQGLKDDLAFLIGRADEAADRLERAVGEARTAKPAPTSAATAEAKLRAVPSAKAVRTGEPSGEPPAHVGRRGLPPAGQELLRALQGMR